MSDYTDIQKRVVGVPSLTLVDFVKYGTALGATLIYEKGGTFALQRAEVRWVMDKRLFYFKTYRELFLRHEYVQDTDVAFVADSTINLMRYHIPIFGCQVQGDPDRATSALVCWGISPAEFEHLALNTQPIQLADVKADLYSPDAKIVERIVQASILSPILSFMYRIPKELRSEIQGVAFGWLAGTVRVLGPVENYPALKALLMADKALRLRKACTEGKKSADLQSVADTFSVDMFEISYLLSRVGLRD